MTENTRRILAEFDRVRWRQSLLPLTRVVIVETHRSSICIPDRDSAECELTRVRREHGTNLLKAKITKDRPSKNGDPNERTYRLNYVYRESKTEKLF
jgi:hypothetical protein